MFELYHGTELVRDLRFVCRIHVSPRAALVYGIGIYMAVPAVTPLVNVPSILTIDDSGEGIVHFSYQCESGNSTFTVCTVNEDFTTGSHRKASVIPSMRIDGYKSAFQGYV